MSTEELTLEELREIRKLLTPPAKPPRPEGFKEEFLSFLKKYNVLALAVAFIMAIYLGALVQALVTDLVMPVVEIALLALGGGTEIPWEEIEFFSFRVGHFAGALLTFIIVAIVIFVIVKVAARFGFE
jgi:large conductance mechanosensitive channel